MPELLQEIQSADMLGFQQIADFRRALRRAEVPQPTRELGVGSKRVQVWSRRALQEWIDRDNRLAPSLSLDEAIKNFR
ncbi:MAG: hypothetical protein ACRBM6_08775 [Geminicoccales bacterium]